MTGRELDVAQRDTGVEGSHDEPGPQHVPMDRAEPGPPADRLDPPGGSAPIECRR